MARRWGWMALAALSALFLVGTALVGAWTIGIAIRDGGRWGVLTALVPVALGLLFWRWIALGAWLRANPPIDPETGEPVREPEEVGPWGVVGRVLLGIMVLALVGIGVWAATAGRQATDRAETVRDQAERIARRRSLTVADVADAQDARIAWASSPDGEADPYQALLPGTEATVIRVSVSDEGAAILIEPDRAPPCVVVTVDRNDLIRSRLSDACP